MFMWGIQWHLGDCGSCHPFDGVVGMFLLLGSIGNFLNVQFFYLLWNNRCKTPVEQALRDAKLSFSDLKEVILVGGSTRIPAVQALVKKLTGKEPNVTVNPDEVVALGAAVQVSFINDVYYLIFLLFIVLLFVPLIQITFNGYWINLLFPRVFSMFLFLFM